MTSTTSTTSTTITRAYSTHKPIYQRFHQSAVHLFSSSGALATPSNANTNKSHPYARQYSHVYAARLEGLRDRCVANAKTALKSLNPFYLKDGGAEEVDNVGGIDGVSDVEVVDRIIEVKENQWSILVGTLVKETDPKRRPPVNVDGSESVGSAHSFLFFDNYEPDGKWVGKIDGKNNPLEKQELMRSHLFDYEKGDLLHLEDESGRVELTPVESNTKDTGNLSRLTPVSDSHIKPNSNALDPNKVATGVVAAVIGKISSEKGAMQVHSIYFAGPPPHTTSKSNESKSKRAKGNGNVMMRGPLYNRKNDNDEPTLLLVSGLACGAESSIDEPGTNGDGGGGSLALRREMLLEWVSNSTIGNGAGVCRVIVAGGGVGPPNSITKLEKGSDPKSPTVFSLHELDLYLSELLSLGIPVDYIPGVHDPTNCNWPQRPIHSCLLPLSCGFEESGRGGGAGGGLEEGKGLFTRGTNPFEAILGGDPGESRGRNEHGECEGGIRVLGSDGLNIADLRRYLSMPNHDNSANCNDVEMKKNADNADNADTTQNVHTTRSIDALHQTYLYGHMAPTGPDSLPLFPSSESDPFVLVNRPGIYFAGNCAGFETRLVDGMGGMIDDASEIDDVAGVGGDGVGATRLICIPSFAITGEVVLVNLKTLRCEVVSFADI